MLLARLLREVPQGGRQIIFRTLAITGIILTMVEKSNVSKELQSQLRESSGPVAFKTRVGGSVELEEAHARHQSIFDYASTSPGAVAYKALVSEIRHGIGKENGNRPARRNPAKDDTSTA